MIWQFDPPEPGLNEPGGWVAVSALGAEITGARGAYSQPSALVLAASYFSLAHFEGEVYTELAVTPGATAKISMLVKANETTDEIALRLRVYDKDPLVFYGALLLLDSTITKAEAGVGFHLWEPGSYTPATNTIVIQLSVADPAHQHSTRGAWVIDDVIAADGEEEEMSKRREVRNALVDRIKSVTVANGYGLTLDPSGVVKGPVLFPTGIKTWPHVSVTFGEFRTEVHTLGGRMKTTLQCRVGLACQTSASATADDLCDDLYAEITNAICVGPRDPDVNSTYRAPWLGLAYIDDVQVSDGDPADLPPDVARGMALLQLTVTVVYNHLRRQV